MRRHKNKKKNSAFQTHSKVKIVIIAFFFFFYIRGFSTNGVQFHISTDSLHKISENLVTGFLMPISWVQKNF